MDTNVCPKCKEFHPKSVDIEDKDTKLWEKEPGISPAHMQFDAVELLGLLMEADEGIIWNRYPQYSQYGDAKSDFPDRYKEGDLNAPEKYDSKNASKKGFVIFLVALLIIGSIAAGIYIRVTNPVQMDTVPEWEKFIGTWESGPLRTLIFTSSEIGLASMLPGALTTGLQNIQWQIIETGVLTIVYLETYYHFNYVFADFGTTLRLSYADGVVFGVYEKQ